MPRRYISSSVAVFNLLDVDKDGKIEVEEFEAWWTGDKRIDYSMV